MTKIPNEPIAHLVWLQGRRAADDVEDYYEVARPGDKSVDGSDPFPVYAALPHLAKPVDGERLAKAAEDGWNACRRQVYLLSEDYTERTHALKGVDTVEGNFYRGQYDVAKSFAKAFSAFEAKDCDYFKQIDCAALGAGTVAQGPSDGAIYAAVSKRRISDRENAAINRDLASKLTAASQEPLGYASDYGLGKLASKAHWYCLSVSKAKENEYVHPLYAAPPPPAAVQEPVAVKDATHSPQTSAMGINADLLKALKYVRRYLKPEDHDVSYVDDVIDNAEGRGLYATATEVALSTSQSIPPPEIVDYIACPCTTFEQDEDCPVGQPSLLCSACEGKGVATIEDIVALAAEMLKVAEQVDELEDPFAAWESIALFNSHHNQMQKALCKIADMVDAEDADLDDAISIAVAALPVQETQSDTTINHVNGGAYRKISVEEWRELGGDGNKFCDWHEGIGYVIYDEQAREQYLLKMESHYPLDQATTETGR
ncbi:hypothetical protein G6L45_16065 [Agrobacterium rhizogenes]|nr:hypothetical protein [Rhizobium rhizogenes]NTH97001.1 hypothetical protein [Rhizobium rhizogenes]NTJ15187.1 hypothetical protein [Rhizobium rhizogenes]